MPNGLSVKNQEDFAELYIKDAPLAMSLLFQNISDLKLQCNSRLVLCKQAQAKSKVKNMVMQALGGIVGGAATVWAYLKVFVDK